MLEKELKKIYRFFVLQERELYLQINTRLHVRPKYETFSLIQLEKELDELQTLSSYATSLSCYIYLNITGMSKILKKFDKKFKRYNLDFTKNFIIDKYQKKNSDLLYIHQYKILDEVGACVEQLKNELFEKYSYLMKNPIKEINNARSEVFSKKIKTDDNNNNIISSELLLNNENNEENKESENSNNFLSNKGLENLKNKFQSLNNSIDNMEAFYHSINLVFEVWMRYIKMNEYKSHIYSVKSTKEIYDKDVIKGKDEILKKPEHFLSLESYRNIRIVLTQAFIMSLCYTYYYPTIYYLLKSEDFSSSSDDEGNREKRGLYCGLIISMGPIGGLLSITYSKYMVNKSYKIPLMSSSILSFIGNLLFILGIYFGSIFLLCFGTLITGFSLNTPVHRRYLLYFIPKRKINKYLLFFKLYTLLGNSCGPLLGFLSLCIFNHYYKRDEHRVFNEYTFPSWLCFFASIILVVIIYLMFSEPLSSKFIVYAEGQDPTETMKRADSFSLDDSLTIFESEKLDEINQKVSSFNDENQFDDTNLVSSTIHQLIDVEVEPRGTVRKAFWVIMAFFFILRFIIISYITMAPPYLYKNLFKNNEITYGNKAEKIISLLMFVTFILFIPAFCLNFFYISLRVNKIFYIKLLVLILLALQLITTSFVIPSDKEPFLFSYFVSFLLTVLLAYISEDQLIYFYTQIIPTNFELMKIKGITGVYLMRYLGSICGSIVSLFGLLYDNIYKNYEELVIITENSFSMAVLLILIIIFFIYSDKFADRPIRRLVYSKNPREIKRTEL